MTNEEAKEAILTEARKLPEATPDALSEIVARVLDPARAAQFEKWLIRNGAKFCAAQNARTVDQSPAAGDQNLTVEDSAGKSVETDPCRPTSQ